jgi:hypothetical protein
MPCRWPDRQGIFVTGAEPTAAGIVLVTTGLPAAFPLSFRLVKSAPLPPPGNGAFAFARQHQCVRRNDAFAIGQGQVGLESFNGRAPSSKP